MVAIANISVQRIFDLYDTHKYLIVSMLLFSPILWGGILVTNLLRHTLPHGAECATLHCNKLNY